MILNEGELDGKCYFWLEICCIFIMEKLVVSYCGLGYDKFNLKDLKVNVCVFLVLVFVYGYIGFMGICVWVDLENDLVYIFLSNCFCFDVWNGKLNSMKI